MSNSEPQQTSSTRRDFLKAGAALGSAAALAGAVPVHAAGSDVLRVGFIGCGHRGTGAMVNCLRVGPQVKLVAMADLFPDQLQNSLNLLRNEAGLRDRHQRLHRRQDAGAGRV